MKSLAVALAVLIASAPALADPFPKGNPKIGRTLHDKSCMPCHASMLGGDGSGMYTRPDRKIQSAQQLLTRVRICNTNAGAGWFPEEEVHVAAYLNSSFYHFK